MKYHRIVVSLTLVAALSTLLLCLCAGAEAHDSGESVECPRGETPNIDGVVETAEWEDAESVTVNFEGTQATIYFKHDETMLYFGFDIQEGHNSAFPDTRVYVDTLHDHADSPQEDDYQLYINPDNNGLIERQGDGGGWTEEDIEDWDGDWNDDNVSHWSTEYAVDFNKLDTDRSGDYEALPVGFLVYGNTPGLFGVWPDTMDEEDPSTWGHMEFPHRAPPGEGHRELDLVVREGAEMGAGENDSLNFTLRNRGSEEENVTLTLSGDQADWVSLNLTTLILQAGESVSITVNVTAPEDTREGFYEAVITAEAIKSNFTVDASHELVIRVVETSGGDDEDDDGFLPGFAISGLLLSLLGTLLLIGKRNRFTV